MGDFFSDIFSTGFSEYLIMVSVISTGILIFLAPAIFIFAIIRSISDRIRGVKRINNLVISRYAWYSLKNDAVLTDSSIKQRITRIVNFVAGQEEMIKRVRDN